MAYTRYAPRAEEQYSVLTLVSASIQADKESREVCKDEPELERDIKTKSYFHDRFSTLKSSTCTEEQQQEAKDAIEFVSSCYTVSLLKAEKMSDFTKVLVEESQKEMSARPNVLMYFANVYRTMQSKQTKAEKLFDFAGSEWQGNVGEKLQLTINVFEVRFIQTLNLFSFTAYDKDNNLYEFFMGNKDLQQKLEDAKEKGVSVSITAKVKKHTNRYQSPIKVTQLNYVKSC